ncbi:recombinase family protein [Phycisphaerales bacterium AB-hyl4]|uniref:Recombinase family protein n=1 Tax=Natronomicrosphaera hydrolytica TaxID=3242702 RepID=A0ABV4U6R3_9BACT
MGSKATALAYLRVSGRGQVDGDGFHRQRHAIDKYAKAHGLTIAGEYRDEGVTGTAESFDRPGLTDMLVRIKANGVRVVLVERSDRLARDLVVGEIILREFKDLGVSVIEAEGGNDLTAGDDDPTRVLIRQVLGAVSQFEKSVIVSKLRAARERQRRTTGRCEGRKPFGFYEGEPEVIERIAAMRRKPKGRKRMSYAEIAEALNAEGVTTRNGGPWKPGTVYAIVKRERPSLAGA